MSKNIKKTDLIIVAVILLLIAAGIVFSVVFRNNDRSPQNSAEKKLSSYTDYNGKRIGIMTGTSLEVPTFEFFPDSQYFYYNNASDMAVALMQGKIDGFLGDEPQMRMLCQEQDGIAYIKQKLTEEDYAFGFQKDNDRADLIRSQFDEMLAEFKSDGKIDEIRNKWFGSDESVKTVDLTGFSGENGELKVVTTASDMPFSYIKDNAAVGLSIELVEKFCRRYGYTPVIEDVDFASRVTGLSTGKYDMCASSLTITEERKESISFSEPFYNSGIVLVVRKSEIDETPQSEIITVSTPISHFAGSLIGVGMGSMFDVLVKEKIPDAKIRYFNTYSDMVTALESGKVDALCLDEPVIRYIIASEHSQIIYLDEKLKKFSYGFVFPKTEDGRKLRDEFNEFLGRIKGNGELKDVENRWFSSDPALHTLPEIKDSGKGTLKLAAEAINAPFVYLEQNKIVGYEIELAYRFCKEYGYGLEISEMNFDAVMPSLNSGVCDFGCDCITITDERAESVYFSEPDYEGGGVLAVRDTAGGGVSSYSFNGTRAGIITGSIHDDIIKEKLPDSTIFEYNGYSDMTAALKSDKIDYFLAGSNISENITEANPDLMYLSDVIDVLEFGVMFPKNPDGNEVRDKFNEYLGKIKADGTLDEIIRFWQSGRSESAVVDMSGLDSGNETLTLAVSAEIKPFSYISSGKLAGIDPDIAVRFCKEYGYDLDVKTVDFGGMMPGLASGIYDFAMNCVTITEERKESADFSDPYFFEDLHLVVRKQDVIADAEKNEVPDLIKSIADSFEKNFIREERWKLILEGVGTTSIITVMSVLFGSILAFLICMFRRTGSVLANAISNIYVKLLQGTPIVVLLMILYYVILGKTGLSAVWVAIVGFSLNFGAYASEIMRSGIESIDAGQREAALALGYSENQAFFRFIFPQAAVRFLPVYTGEIISLLKGTSIVGYIAIQDLTKMGDIIRSRTYEAFFPLIATAVIYFILAWIISLILKLVLSAVSTRKKRSN